MILHDQYTHYEYFVIEDKDLFNSVVSALIPIGAIIGAPLGGPLASIGRRYAIMIIAGVFTSACVLIAFFDFYCLLTARLLMGLCVGAYASVSPLFVTEIAPKQIAGPLGTANQMMAMLGVSVAYAIGFIVPLSDDPNALTTGMWRFVLAFPGVITLAQLLLVLLVFTYDTPYYYEIQQDRENYRAVLNNIFYVRGPSFRGPLDDSFNKDGEQVQVVEPKEVTWAEMFNEPYKRALAVGLFLSVFHQATGINSIVFYSNEIFTKGTIGAEAELAAKWGTFAVGVFGVFGVLFAIALLNDYGRKTLLLFGTASMGIVQ